MTLIEATAKSWATALVKEVDSDAWKKAHDSFLVGWQAAAVTAVNLLKKQHEGCQPGQLVSYAIAADVLRVDLKEYEQQPN